MALYKPENYNRPDYENALSKLKLWLGLMSDAKEVDALKVAIEAVQAAQNMHDFMETLSATRTAPPMQEHECPCRRRY